MIGSHPISHRSPPATWTECPLGHEPFSHSSHRMADPTPKASVNYQHGSKRPPQARQRPTKSRSATLVGQMPECPLGGISACSAPLAPYVLPPYVLSPYVLSPYVLSPCILSPYVLLPCILTPCRLTPYVLTVSILSPNRLSPYILSVCVLSPYSLSP